MVLGQATEWNNRFSIYENLQTNFAVSICMKKSEYLS